MAELQVETMNSRLPAAMAKGKKEILKVYEDPKLIGFPTAIRPISEYENHTKTFKQCGIMAGSK